ncbi:MAG: hypothetical protein IJ087_12015 [Eggerthellaceae bacterium]|nr:hypothetical protein [Eggerthellaceae bacterium]
MKCPNCEATLVFNAETGMLECRFCDSAFAPDEADLASASGARAEEHAQTEDDGSQQPQGGAVSYTSYVCSNCGAELVGTYDTSAIGFCSYCGGENIIASRISAQRPDRIVPFTRSKESCKQIYFDSLKGMPFVPKELKDARRVDEIRGIYVPYSIYRMHHDGDIDLEFKKHDSNYDYRYHLTGAVSSDCAVPIDASVQLDDYIGSTVFPYDSAQEAPFNESYLSTYYVELPDADDSAYLPAVTERVLEYENDCAAARYAPDSTQDKRDTASQRVALVGKDIVLAPLYFLTYRNQDKVCYTVLPGTEGNESIYAEIPIDIPKYLMALLAVAAAIWAVLSFVPFVPTLPHNDILLVMGALSFIALYLQKGEYDKQRQRSEYFAVNSKKGAIIGIGSIFFVSFIVFCAFGPSAVSGLAVRVVLTALTVVTYIAIIRLKSRAPGIDIRFSHLLFVVSALMIALGFADEYLSVPDEAMYAMMAVSFAAALVGFYGIIKVFNASCERERPHFTREGGHNAAQDI